MPIATIITIAVGFVGLAILVWGLRGRRTRGTPRCRRCWYDMSGHDTLTCPECGRVARTDRELVRPRRRWVTVAVGAIVLVAAGVSAWVIRVGIDAALPNAAHIAMCGEREASERELVRRMNDARLAAWEWRWLVHRTATALENESDTTRLRRELQRLHVIQTATQLPYHLLFAYELDSPFSVDLSATVPGLERLLAHEERMISNEAWVLLRPNFPSIAREHVAEVYVRNLQYPGRFLRQPDRLYFGEITLLLDRPIRMSFPTEHWGDATAAAFVRSLRTCGSMEAARPLLVEGLDSESEVVRGSSLLLLYAAGPLDDTAQDRVLDALDDANVVLSSAARQIAFSIPLDARLTSKLDEALNADNEIDQHWAATFIAERGPRAWHERARLPWLLAMRPITSELVSHGMEHMEKDADGCERVLKVAIDRSVEDAELLMRLGVSREAIGDRLLAALDETCPFDDDPLPQAWGFPHTTWRDLNVASVLAVLTALDIDRARPLAEAHLLAPSAHVRREAGCALLRFGGDVGQATSLIVDGSIGAGRSELPDTLPEDLRRRGLALSKVTPLLADPRPEIRLLGMRMLAAAGPDHASAAEPVLRTLLQDSDHDARMAATQTLNGFILDD